MLLIARTGGLLAIQRFASGMQATPLASETIALPRSILRPDSIWAAIDSGTSLLKVVFVDKEDAASDSADVVFRAHMYPNGAVEAVLQVVKERAFFPSHARRFAMSGVGFGFLKGSVEKALDVDAEFVTESDAIVVAAKVLLKHKGEDDLFHPTPPNTKNHRVGHAPRFAAAIERMRAQMTADDHDDHGPPMSLLNIGSSNIYIHVTADGEQTPEMAPFGGLPFLGLASLLLGTSNYDDIVSLADEGDVARCYWLLGECAREGRAGGATDPALPYVPFGRVGSRPELEYSRADVAAGLVHFFAQIVHATAVQIAQIRGVSRYYVTGNWVRCEAVRRCLYQQRSVGVPNVVEFKFFKFCMMTALGAFLEGNGRSR